MRIQPRLGWLAGCLVPLLLVSCTASTPDPSPPPGRSPTESGSVGNLEPTPARAWEFLITDEEGNRTTLRIGLADVKRQGELGPTGCQEMEAADGAVEGTIVLTNSTPGRVREVAATLEASQAWRDAEVKGSLGALVTDGEPRCVEANDPRFVVASGSRLPPGGETTASIVLFLEGYFADDQTRTTAHEFGLCLDEPSSVAGPGAFQEGDSYCIPVARG